MSQLRNELIMREINGRLKAAHILRQRFDESDSAYLLELLAFELLLKLLHRIVKGCDAACGHKYSVIFNKLQDEIQNRVLSIAEEFEPGLDISSKHTQILETLGKNFVELRYPYEMYNEGMTYEEYREKGDEWEASDAPDEGADFTYYPRELAALTFALKQIIGMD